ncbi:MAG TPA: TIGR03118 family protein, partial [Bryobacteraceae bacterium]|nr:TIGR03118 family protein [Bryobacteraceae bacterium]
LYRVNGETGAVSKVPLVVNIPASLVGAPKGPTGQVFNGTSNFVVSQGSASGPALFIFAALNGTISGWNPSVPPPPPSTTAQLAATGTPPPAIYTGLAMGTSSQGVVLYAANPAAGRVDVFDRNFVQIHLSGSFSDPALPTGDAPFNIVNLDGRLFVTYQGPTGVVNIFDTDGQFISRFATGGTLHNPWGIVLAPPQFGKFSNALLIGNFNHSPAGFNGPGYISAFNSVSGEFRGLLDDTNGNPVTMDGLWSLRFGNGQNGGIPTVLYFSAGIGSAPGVGIETHGLFGSFRPCAAANGGQTCQPEGLSADPR